MLVRAEKAVEDLGVDGLRAARWSGLSGASVERVSIVEAFPLGTRGGIIVLEAMISSGLPILLTLPLDDPATWAGLHALIAQGGSVDGASGGRLEARSPGEPMSGGDDRGAGTLSGRRIRAMSGDQSHTSVVIDESSVLKLYRRLTSGPNPETEILRELALDEAAPVPRWHGGVELVLPGRATTSVAVEQAFVADAEDAFELLADGLAMWLSGQTEAVSAALPRAIGLATGLLHAALARVEGPGFSRRLATVEDRTSWLRASEATLRASILIVDAIDPELAAALRRAEGSIRGSLRALGESKAPVPLQRIHGDLHLGQVLPTPIGVLLIDFEGDPLQDPVDRRSAASPLRDVATMLRSIDHVARSGLRRAALRLGEAADAFDGSLLEHWLGEARSTFLDGYGKGLGDDHWTPDRDLLRALEMEKELAELIYAGTYLPTWFYAPSGGLRALLGIGRNSESPS